MDNIESEGCKDVQIFLKIAFAIILLLAVARDVYAEEKNTSVGIVIAKFEEFSDGLFEVIKRDVETNLLRYSVKQAKFVLSREQGDSFQNGLQQDDKTFLSAYMNITKFDYVVCIYKYVYANKVWVFIRLISKHGDDPVQHVPQLPYEQEEFVKICSSAILTLLNKTGFDISKNQVY